MRCVPLQSSRAVALAFAGPSAEMFEGRTITILSCAADARGGGYDFYARLLARHIGRHLPGRRRRGQEYAGRRRRRAREPPATTREPEGRHVDRRSSRTRIAFTSLLNEHASSSTIRSGSAGSAASSGSTCRSCWRWHTTPRSNRGRPNDPPMAWGVRRRLAVLGLYPNLSEGVPRHQVQGHQRLSRQRRDHARDRARRARRRLGSWCWTCAKAQKPDWIVGEQDAACCCSSRSTAIPSSTPKGIPTLIEWAQDRRATPDRAASRVRRRAAMSRPFMAPPGRAGGPAGRRCAPACGRVGRPSPHMIELDRDDHRD